jgi:hypothetical protein
MQRHIEPGGFASLDCPGLMVLMRGLEATSVMKAVIIRLDLGYTLDRAQLPGALFLDH